MMKRKKEKGLNKVFAGTNIAKNHFAPKKNVAQNRFVQLTIHIV